MSTRREGRLGFLSHCDVEDRLWTLLSLMAYAQKPSSRGRLLTAVVTMALVFPQRQQHQQHPIWRATTNSGNVMSVVLVPLLIDVLQTEAVFANLARLAVVAFCQMPPAIRDSPSVGRRAVVSLLILAPSLVLCSPYPYANESFNFLVFVSLWAGLYYSLPVLASSTGPFQGVWTAGEWRLVTGLAAISLFYNSSTWYKLEDVEERVTAGSLVAAVAHRGLLGCSVSCAVVATVFHQSIHWLFRLGTVISLTLISLEYLFWVRGEYQYPFPRSLYWLVDFLEETEGDGEYVSWPRYGWIAYWIFCLLLLLPLSPQNASPILARKWFHFVAIVLFVPVTLAAPQLQSLAYAVALAGLILLETIRAQIPPIQAFYHHYLDLDKDHPNRVVVSHAALIAGCALPLWLSLAIAVHNDRNRIHGLWGVLVLGVGDSMAALVGKTYGRRPWSRNNRRTLEGSMAMLISTVAGCLLFQDKPENWQWIWAVVGATLMEAWTSQIDNLILPLFGLVILEMTVTPTSY